MASRDPGPKNSTGLPPGTRFYSPFPFAGMNTQAAPTAISDQEFLWVENFIRLGDGKLRTAYDVGTPLYQATPGKSIVSFFAYSIALNLYFAVFLSDGSALQVSYPQGVVTTIGGAGQFYSASSGGLPACVQYGVQYLLISNNNTSNDYWIWDGTLLYQKGTAAPNGVNILSGGSNYNFSPNLTVFGGLGSGITLTPVVNGGNVVEINITNPGSGYEVGDFPQIAFSGGGSDSSAILTANLTGTGVAAVNITAGGSGYTTATVTFSGGGGSGATGVALIGSGVATLTITAPGSGYTGANVSFSGGGGSGATATATINGGQVVALTITNPGTGYTSNPTVAITGDGTLATATATIQGNMIVGVQMTNDGANYTTAPIVTFGGAGTGATGIAELTTSSGVRSVTINNAGSGFSLPPLISFVGGGAPSQEATGVTTLTATTLQFVNVLASGSLYSVPSGHQPTLQVYGGAVNGPVATPATVAISAFSGGSISAVSVTNGGAGYVIEPFINVTQFVSSSKVTDEGSGAAFQPILTPTTLGSVIISNQGQNYSTAPTAVLGPGANHAAYATISLMPYGLSGACIETYQTRVWIGNPALGPFSTLPPQGDFSVTAPESVTDVATSDGGVLFTNTDGFLQTKYVAIKQSNGYLYFVGDGSCSVVSGLNTSSTPATSTSPAGSPTTTFNYQTVDPQVGGSWRDAVQDFGRNILIANETGVFSLVGGSTTKASDKMDDVFLNAVFPPTSGALTPSAALAHLFNVKHYFTLMTVTDPDTGLLRNVMLTFNGRDWSVTSQSPNLTYIGPQKRGSRFFAWGTDGSALYPLFTKPSSTLVKRLDTKLFGANDPIVTKDVQGFYIQAQDKSTNAAGVAGTVSLAASGAVSELGESTPNQIYTDAYVLSESMGQMGVLLQQPNFQALGPAWPVFGTQTAGIPAMNVGVRFSTQSPDFILSHMLLAYKPGPALA